RIDLTTFTTAEIIEIPNSAGNHSSPFITDNSEYVVAGTRFSVPMDYEEGDVAIDSYKKNVKGIISFLSVEPPTGEMDVDCHLLLPRMNFDDSHTGKVPGSGRFCVRWYNVEQAHPYLEVNAAKLDKDSMLAVNWKIAEEYYKAGKGTQI